MENKQSCNKEWLSSSEVAEMLGMKPATIRFWRSTGQGPKFYRFNRTVLYKPEDIKAWIAERYMLVEPGK